jgi:hypothetical protein
MPERVDKAPLSTRSASAIDLVVSRSLHRGLAKRRTPLAANSTLDFARKARLALFIAPYGPFADKNGQQ